ncbi:TetR/AcrR family transcriptional regulator [Nocardia bovistercoris]|nr:TetR/AcrR family transcriptional regulator [Nocardia bovistercoris]
MLDSSAPIEVVADAVRSGAPRVSLRERKKRQTRARIIEVALDLCEIKGFEATTVEQIAHGADVSPRTVNRYFDTKEDIVLGTLDAFGDAIACALAAQPRTDSDLRALCNAYLHMIERAASSDDDLSFRRFQQTQRIARTSPTVNARLLEYGETKNTMITTVLAERTGKSPEALCVRLVVATWQMLCHVALAQSEEVLVHGEPQVAAHAARIAVVDAYNELCRICAHPIPADSM